MGTAEEMRRERAIKLAEKLLELTPEAEQGLIRRAMQIRDRLRTPMSMVLDKVPGDSTIDKAKRIGITRQCYYAWYRGEYRPNAKQAKRLASITGFSVEEIRGR